MKAAIPLFVIAFTVAILCVTADPECEERKLKNLPVHWPNPTDCRRFYRCRNNVKRTITCLPTKEYSRRTGRCEMRGHGTCTVSRLAPLQGKDNICSNETSGTYLPKEGFCRDFYICNDNKAYQQSCAPGSYFRSDDGNCASDTNKTCWQNKCIGVANGTSLADENFCLVFYICQSNEAIKQTCDSGSYFDSSSKNCKPDKKHTKCWQNYCLDRNDGDFVPNLEDIHKYYICLDHKPVPAECPNDSYFDKLELNCQPIETTTTTPSTDVTTDETTDTTKEISTEPTTVEPTTIEPTTEETTDTTREISTEPTTEPSTEEPTTGTPETTTPCESSTAAPETTTPAPCESSTAAPETTTPAPCESSTVAPETTTPAPCESSTAAPGTTTPAPCKSSTAAPETTTPAPCESSTAAPEKTTPEPCEVSARSTCAGGYREGDIIPHPTSSNNFYICYEGVLLEQSCQAGNYFDAKLGACQRDVDGIHTRSRYDGALLRKLISGSNPNVTTCLGLYREGDILPDTGDCQKFSVCLGGVFVKRRCGTGAYFDVRQKICRFDIDGICVHHSTLNGIIGMIPQTEKGNADKICTCPGGYSSGDIVRHPTDCDKFYVCYNSELHQSECGVGNRFDAAYSCCVPDTDGRCWPSAQENCTCPGGYEPGQMTPHPDNCRSYYICFGGKLVESDCGAGNRFDAETHVCVFDTSGTCKSPDDVCRNKPNNAMVPNSAHCDSFYLCKNGVAVPESCSASDWFDPCAGFCVPDVDTKCRNPCSNIECTTLLPHPDCSKFYICNGGKTTVGTCNKGQRFDKQQQQCVTGSCNNVCAEKPDGTTFPVPNDPNNFYYCLNGEQILRNCETGTTYDTNRGICLLQPSADCNQNYCAAGESANGKIMPPIGGGDGTEFCVCRNGAAYKESCPIGYEFDKQRNICYSNAPCDPSQCMYSADNTLFVNRNDTHSFCMCLTNEAVIVQCPSEGTFDPKELRCVLPPVQDPQCDPNYCLNATANSTFPSQVCDRRSFCVCVDGGAKLKKCPTDYFFNDVLKICLPADNSCDRLYCLDPKNANSVFPMESNERAFCYCDADKAVPKDCPEERIFSKFLKACILEVPDCDINLCSSASSTNAYATPTRNDPHDFCYCTSPHNVARFSCADGKLFDPNKRICIDNGMCEGKYHQYDSIPNADECNKYFMCINGKMLDLTCGDGLYYDSTVNRCVPNDNNQCQIIGSSNCTCPGGYQEGQFLPHPTDCHKFYICADSALHEGDCGESNYFSIKEAHCVRDLDGVCKATPAECTCVGNYREGEMVAQANDPQRFYICTNAQLVSGDCGMGNVFDPHLQICVTRGSRNHVAKKIVKRSVEKLMHEVLCAEGKKQSVPSNCSQYEICLNAQWVRLTCPHQFYYNPEEKQCLEPRDDTICAYARITSLPRCDDKNEGHLAPSRAHYCISYLSCSHKQWRHQFCPAKRFFSASLQTCTTDINNSVCKETKTLNASAVTDKCKYTEVRASERDCATYFMCLEEEWWMQHCPLGTYFNRTLNYCVPNDANQCKSAAEPLEADQLTETSCQREGALRAAPKSCEHFYVCASGTWFPQKCALQQYFNVTQQACVAADGTCEPHAKTHCKPGQLRPVPHNCSAYSRCGDDGNGWVHFECTLDHFFDDVFQTCVLNDGSCSSSGLLRACRPGDVKPHPNSQRCNEFLQCTANGDWQIGSCLKNYTYEHNVKSCILAVGLKRCDKEEFHLSTTTIEPEYNICLGLADGSAVGHLSDCRKFYICKNGLSGFSQSCSSGSFFDKALSHCRPNDGTCPIPQADPCERQVGDVSVPNPDDCTSYYECSAANGTVLHRCAEGEFYHNETRQCRRDNGECRTQMSSNICANQQPGTRLPDKGHCSSYYTCVKGFAVKASCPENQRYDELKNRCMADPERICNETSLGHINSTLSCQRHTNTSYFVDRDDCTRYYDCSSGKAQQKQCEAGRYFDGILLECRPDNGTCMGQKGQQLALSPDPNVCQGRHGYLMADPSNCNDFYVCINNKLRHERCCEGHFFNTTTMQCELLQPVGNTAQNLSNSNKSTKNLTITDSPMQCLDQPANYSEVCRRLEGGGPMAEQGDCRRYIVCVKGQLVSQRCRNGESYDSLMGTCRQNDGTCLLENGQRAGVCQGKHGQLAFDDENCRGYFVCINGQKIGSECADGQYFNKSNNICQLDFLKQCDVKTPKEDINVLPVLKRKPEKKLCADAILGQRYVNYDNKCRSFYICLATDLPPNHVHCPAGTLFDTDTSNCRSSELVLCKET